MATLDDDTEGDPLALKPWERRSDPSKLGVRIVDESVSGKARCVMIDSPWAVQVVRADGTTRACARMGAVLLYDGDRIVIPESESTPVEPAAVNAARRSGLDEYRLAHAPRFDDDEASRLRFDRGDDHWWWYRRELPHGLVLYLHPGGFNARVSVSLAGAGGFEGSWCYPDQGDAWRAALSWNGWRDPPEGWIRHVETLRRRKDGTLASEYVSVHDVPEAKEWR